MNKEEKTIDSTIYQTKQTKSVADTVGECTLGVVLLGAASGTAYLGIEYIPELVSYVQQNAKIATEVVAIAASMVTGLGALGFAKLGFDMLLHKEEKQSELVLDTTYKNDKVIKNKSDSLLEAS